MKKLILAAVIVAGVAALIAQAAQDTALDGVAEVRNPVRLKTWLETNAQDAETRLAAVEATEAGGALASGKIVVGNSGGTGEAQTVTGDISLSDAGVSAIASGVIVNADVATNAAIVSTKLATAAQTSLGKADTALQPNAVAVTNTIVGVGDITNVIVVIGGQITSWTITQ